MCATVHNSLLLADGAALARISSGLHKGNLGALWTHAGPSHTKHMLLLTEQSLPRRL